MVLVCLKGEWNEDLIMAKGIMENIIQIQKEFLYHLVYE